MRYETSIEVECEIDESFDSRTVLDEANKVPFLVEKSQQSDYEIRFRFKSGLDGLKGLYSACEFLKKYCIYTQSGIHIHVDMRDCGALFENSQLKKLTKEGRFDWVLNELDTWEYPGTYNGRKVYYGKSGWICFRSWYNTAEFRICEMTFEYPQLLKRIHHCNDIICKIKKDLLSLYPELVDRGADSILDDEIMKTISSRNVFIT